MGNLLEFFVGKFDENRSVKIYCEQLQHGFQFWQLTTELNDKIWFQFLGFLSGLICFFFFLLIWQYKELRVHPMRIFMFLTLSDALTQFNSSASHNACKLGFDQLFTWTVFYSTSDYARKQTLQLLFHSSSFIQLSSSLLSLCLNMVLCADLIFSLQNPLQASEPHDKLYFALSVIYSMAMAFWIEAYSFGSLDTAPVIAAWIIWIQELLFVCLAVASIIYAFVKLGRPGISREVRSLVLKRHVFTITVFTVANLYFYFGFWIVFRPNMNWSETTQRQYS